MYSSQDVILIEAGDITYHGDRTLYSNNQSYNSLVTKTLSGTFKRVRLSHIRFGKIKREIKLQRYNIQQVETELMRHLCVIYHMI